MGFKDTLGSIWPNYGAIEGRGSYGQTFNPDKASENAIKEYEDQKAKENAANIKRQTEMMKHMKKGGKVSPASKRADGCAMRGKTKGRIV